MTIDGRATGTLEADGNTQEVTTRGAVTVHASNDFGGGSIAWQRLIGADFVPITDDGAALAFTDDNDAVIYLQGRNVVRGVLSGATSPDLVWEIVSHEP